MADNGQLRSRNMSLAMISDSGDSPGMTEDLQTKSASGLYAHIRGKIPIGRTTVQVLAMTADDLLLLRL